MPLLWEMLLEAVAPLHAAVLPLAGNSWNSYRIANSDDFTGVVKNAMSGLGFDTDASMVTFPIDLFMAESDLYDFGYTRV